MEKVRYHLLDEIRGFAVLCMVVFHGFFSVQMVLGHSWAADCINFFAPAEPYFAAAFIFISGVSSTLSSSNLKNALRLSAVAAAISAVTIAATAISGNQMSIYFGVIHCLAICLFIAAVPEKITLKHPAALLAASAVLFLITFDLVFGYPFLPPLGLSRLGVFMPFGYKGLWWLLPFGFPEPTTPPMGDYFPLVPWVFMFLLGRAAASLKGRGVLPGVAQKSRVKPLAFVGRHALTVYILHQPIIFGLCYIILFVSGGSI